MNRRLRAICLYTACLMVLPTCGKKKVDSSLTIALSPDNSFILPGETSNCKDYFLYEESPENGLSQSVQPFRVNFPSFKFFWDSTKILVIAQLKLTIRHPSISGGKYECKLTGDELNTLLAYPQGKIPGKAPGAKAVEMDSSVQSTRVGYPVCGFDCGGIQLNDNVGSFKAKAELEAIGYSYTSDGSAPQEPVKTVITPTVEYFK